MTSHAGSSSLWLRLYQWCSYLSGTAVAEGDHEHPVNNSEDPPTLSDDLEDPLPFTDDFTLGLTIDEASIARILSMGLRPPIISEHDLSDDSAVAVDQAPDDSSMHISDMTIKEADDEVHGLHKREDLTFSDIKILDEVPTFPEDDNDTGSCDALEEGSLDDSEEDPYQSWIPIPWVLVPNENIQYD